MAKQSSQELGTDKIGKLLVKQSVPAAVGFLMMSIYQIIDTIFLGNYIGANAIGAVTIVAPITFLIAAFGMAIGIGGASVISRSLGENRPERANRAFGNQTTFTIILGLLITLLAWLFTDPILKLFGAAGEILPVARTYFLVTVPAIPFLAMAMMSNNVIRAEGKSRVAMMVLVVPAVLNIVLDAVFIAWLGWGVEGAALATAIGYIGSYAWAFFYFVLGNSELQIGRRDLKPDWPVAKEIFSIGGVTVVRQGSISLLAIVLNHSLFQYGGELAVNAYGVVQRVMMFAFFPIIGIMQGFMPIAGYNYGAKQYQRVKETIRLAATWGTFISGFIVIIIALLASQITYVFISSDPELLELAPYAMRFVFMAAPLVAIQLIGAHYFQAIGKVWPALILTLTKQAFFLIPYILLFPLFFDLDGVWYAFPAADICSAAVCGWVIYREVKRNLS